MKVFRGAARPLVSMRVGAFNKDIYDDFIIYIYMYRGTVKIRVRAILSTISTGALEEFLCGRASLRRSAAVLRNWRLGLRKLLLFERKTGRLTCRCLSTGLLDVVGDRKII